MQYANLRKAKRGGNEDVDKHSIELAKTCSEVCTQKNICDQIVEGFIDGDTTKHLL